MTTTDTLTKSSITLRGSAQLVSEFFFYGINSILYQRGVYPAETFKKCQQYGLTLLTSGDDKLNSFLKSLTQQIEDRMAAKELKRLVIVICNVHTKEVLERWQFEVETDANATETSTTEKPLKKIKQEICDVIRQVTASVTFLPLLETACSFDVLIYIHKSAEKPVGWEESDAKKIPNSQEVQFRSFSTAIHSVETKVSYKVDD